MRQHKPRVAATEAKRQPRAKLRAITRRGMRRLKRVQNWISDTSDAQILSR